MWYNCILSKGLPMSLQNMEYLHFQLELLEENQRITAANKPVNLLETFWEFGNQFPTKMNDMIEALAQPIKNGQLDDWQTNALSVGLLGVANSLGSFPFNLSNNDLVTTHSFGQTSSFTNRELYNEAEMLLKTIYSDIFSLEERNWPKGSEVINGGEYFDKFITASDGSLLVLKKHLGDIREIPTSENFTVFKNVLKSVISTTKTLKI